MLNKVKIREAIIKTVFELFVLLLPLIWSIVSSPEHEVLPKFGTPWFWIFYGILVICAIIIGFQIKNIFIIAKDTQAAYTPKVIDQIGSISWNKYQKFCGEIIHNSYSKTNDILLYDAHATINDILAHIKTHIADITGVSLSNISVDFIYKYMGEGEYWQTINGCLSCSIGTLDDLVEHSESMYHYLYANNIEYKFFNDKSKAEWRIYKPSMRDGDERENWGSIYCKRILCSIHQDRVIDGIISISTYNEKFTKSKFKINAKRTEHLINNVVDCMKNIIRVEMASIYLRHRYIRNKQIETLKSLYKPDYDGKSDVFSECKYKDKEDFAKEYVEKLSEENRIKLLNEEIIKFKTHYNGENPNYFELDSTIDIMTDAALNYTNNKQNKNTIE